MNALIGIGIIMLCIALFFKTKPKESEKKIDTIEVIEEDEIQTQKIDYKEIKTQEESESKTIINELKKINQTLSFFKDIMTIIIIFTIMKYILIITIFTKTTSTLYETLNTLFKY